MTHLLKFCKPIYLIYLLACFFIFGAIGNILAPANIAADYHRWGYPDWFHYLTGLLELTTGTLLFSRSWRFYGAILGILIMSGACITVLLHQEYTHAIAPLVILILCILTAKLSKKTNNQ